MVWDEINTRLENLAENPIARAFAISLIFHFFLFGSLETAYRLGWTRQSLLTAVLLANRARLEPRLLAEAKKNNPQEPTQVPVVFVEVNPAQAVDEAPKNTQYYSTHNTRAGNLDTRIDSSTPKISGTQDKVPKTTDAPRATPMPLLPAPLAENKVEPERPKAEPQPLQPAAVPAQSGPKPGDLALAKPMDAPKLSVEPNRPPVVESAPPARARPRTIAAALQQQGMLAGDKMKQDGGMKRFSLDGLDVRATPFASYDQMIIAAIQKRWYDLLEDRDFARNQMGKVVLTFRLNSDGRVTDMQVQENEVTEILALICQRAVRDPSPFLPWPSDMRRLVGADYRDVKFTFHHN